jgi:hypothetical protein
MTRESLSQLGLQLAIALVLALPVHYLLNQFEIATHIPVEGFSRGAVIGIVCVFLPSVFFRYYEIRRRA